MRAATTNALHARPAGIIKGVDMEFTGRVERVDVELLQTLLGQGIVPVVPPLGFDGDGKTYRVNSDSAAVAVADAVKAIKLIYMTSDDGLVVKGELLRQVSVDELDGLLQRHRGDFAPESIWAADWTASFDGKTAGGDLKRTTSGNGGSEPIFASWSAASRFT